MLLAWERGDEPVLGSPAHLGLRPYHALLRGGSPRLEAPGAEALAIVSARNRVLREAAGFSPDASLEAHWLDAETLLLSADRRGAWYQWLEDLFLYDCSGEVPRLLAVAVRIDGDIGEEPWYRPERIELDHHADAERILMGYRFEDEVGEAVGLGVFEYELPGDPTERVGGPAYPSDELVYDELRTAARELRRALE